MSPARRRAVAAVLVATALAAGGYAVLQRVITATARDAVTRELAPAVRAATGGALEVGAVHAALLAGRLRLSDVRIVRPQDAATTPFFVADRIEARIGLGALLHGRVDTIRTLTADAAVLQVTLGDEGGDMPRGTPAENASAPPGATQDDAAPDPERADRSITLAGVDAALRVVVTPGLPDTDLAPTAFEGRLTGDTLAFGPERGMDGSLRYAARQTHPAGDATLTLEATAQAPGRIHLQVACHGLAADLVRPLLTRADIDCTAIDLDADLTCHDGRIDASSSLLKTTLHDFRFAGDARLTFPGDRETLDRLVVRLPIEGTPSAPRAGTAFGTALAIALTDALGVDLDALGLGALHRAVDPKRDHRSPLEALFR